MNYRHPDTRGKRNLIATIIAYCVALHGALILATPLIFISLADRTLHFYPGRLVFDVQLFLALALIYISMQLSRRKQTAWFITIGLYGVLAGLSVAHLLSAHAPIQLAVGTIRDIGVPIMIVTGLVLSRRTFTVRSDIRTFAYSLRVSVVVLMATLAYGTVGFMILDQHDFHQEISLFEAAHRTIDQLDLTTGEPLEPLTRRADAFIDSLSLLSISSVGYVFFSLFQPIRARLSDQSVGRADAERLLRRHPSTSEDFFKLWPHDKFYYFNGARTAALAYGVRSHIALVVGDPMGDPASFGTLLTDFDSYARVNDWAVAYVHTEPRYKDAYKEHGFSLQKIGEEAIVDIDTFVTKTAHSKYFRQISNRFTKQGYTVSVLQPPHAYEIFGQLSKISQDWLATPGRKERTFMMGAFNYEYMAQCPVAVLRDKHEHIVAFINQLPSPNKTEANFDLLRHSHKAPGNSNDFMLMEFIRMLQTQGYKTINLGLCPLAGLEDGDNADSVTNNALRFLYANGDRFYSFNGLRRFKAKYDPRWESRYIVYRGGIAGFTKVLSALNRAMRP